MKRKVTLFAADALLLIGLAACGGIQTPATASLPHTEAPSATIPAATATSKPTDAPTLTATSEPTSTPSDTDTSQIISVSFSADILPLLESRCSNCHGGQRTEKSLNLRSYQGVMAGSEDGAAVIPGDAGKSNLATLVVDGKMPKRGPKLTPDQVQLIVNWINAGAMNN